MQILFGVKVPKYWESSSTNLTKNVATNTQLYISNLTCDLERCVMFFPSHVSCFSLGSSWCTCSATSLSLQRCQRCCAKGRTSWTTPRAGAERTWWRGKRKFTLNLRLWKVNGDDIHSLLDNHITDVTLTLEMFQLKLLDFHSPSADPSLTSTPRIHCSFQI